MYCGSCIYWDDDVCYRHGKHINHNGNICKNFVQQIDGLKRNGLEVSLKK